MAVDSPPPAHACPELTPDNSTRTSSSLSSVNWNRNAPHREEDTSNSQEHNNALHIYNSGNYQASHSHSPTSAQLVPPPVSLRSLTPTDQISPIDIGSPFMQLSFDPQPPSSPRSARIISFVTEEPTVIHSSNPSSSQGATITPQSRGQRARGLFRRFRARLSKVSGWFRGAFSRANGGERSEAKPRRRLSLGLGFLAAE